MCLVPAIGSIIKPMICTHGSMVCCLVWGTIKKRKPSLWFAFVNQKYSQFLHFEKFYDFFLSKCARKPVSKRYLWLLGKLNVRTMTKGNLPYFQTPSTTFEKYEDLFYHHFKFCKTLWRLLLSIIKCIFHLQTQQ